MRFARGAAEQRMHRLADRLAAQVPERHVDRAHGVDDHAAAAVHRGAEIHPPPELADLEGVGADQHVLDRQAHGVGARRLDAGLGHPGIGVAFADAGDAAVGVDDDDEAVLRGGGEARVVVGRQQDVAFDVGDLQARRRAVETGRDGCKWHGFLTGDAAGSDGPAEYEFPAPIDGCG